MNKRQQLAKKLRELAAFVERSHCLDQDAEAGIRLAELETWWERENLGDIDPLQACRDRQPILVH